MRTRVGQFRALWSLDARLTLSLCLFLSPATLLQARPGASSPPSEVIKPPKLLFQPQISKLAPDWMQTGQIICFLLNKALACWAVGSVLRGHCQRSKLV